MEGIPARRTRQVLARTSAFWLVVGWGLMGAVGGWALYTSTLVSAGLAPHLRRSLGLTGHGAVVAEMVVGGGGGVWWGARRAGRRPGPAPTPSPAGPAWLHAPSRGRAS